mmetsp:Transcript_29056/g.60800  ORF Transcript_29056/g.60800 Transcript_29056/m.60800 type:complete len:230 (+) Transcript_29056:318-1007(+)
MDFCKYFFFVSFKPQHGRSIATQQRLDTQHPTRGRVLFRHSRIPQNNINVMTQNISSSHCNLLCSKASHTHITGRRLDSQSGQHRFQNALNLHGVRLHKVITVACCRRVSSHCHVESIFRHDRMQQTTLETLERRFRHPSSTLGVGLVRSSNYGRKLSTAFLEASIRQIFFTTTIFRQNGLHGTLRQINRFGEKLGQVILVHLPSRVGKLITRDISVGETLVEIILGTR